MQLQTELLPLGLLPLVVVLVQAPVVEPELVPEPYLELEPQSLTVLGSELHCVP